MGLWSLAGPCSPRGTEARGRAGGEMHWGHQCPNLRVLLPPAAGPAVPTSGHTVSGTCPSSPSGSRPRPHPNPTLPQDGPVTYTEVKRPQSRAAPATGQNASRSSAREATACPPRPATHGLQGSPGTSGAPAHAVGPLVPGPRSRGAPEPQVPLSVLRTDAHGAPDGAEPSGPRGGAGRGAPTRTAGSSTEPDAAAAPRRGPRPPPHSPASPACPRG